MSNRQFLSAREAAEELGVSLPTLYSYVSRKQITTVSAHGDNKRKLYRVDDIRRIKTEAKAAHSARKPALVEHSDITRVTIDGPLFRGQSAIALAETETIESVAELLLDAPGIFNAPPPRFTEGATRARLAIGELSASELAISLFPSLEMANPKAFDLSPLGYARTTTDVVRYYGALLGRAQQPSDAPLHEFIVGSLNADPVYIDIVRRTLVLGADHDLDPTTYAVRAVANTGATPFYAVIVGLSAFRGRRLQFGRSELVQRMIEEVFSAPDPESPVIRAFRHGDPMLGFGSIVYGAHDPRATALYAAIKRQLDGDAELRKLDRAIEVGGELTGKGPSFTLLISFIRHKLGLPAADVSFIAAGRIVGWCAHALEQYQSRELFRPRSLEQ